jgi:hypothetical protein
MSKPTCPLHPLPVPNNHFDTVALVVLGKFGFKPIQAWFKPNQTRLELFGLGISWMKLNGLVSGLGVPNSVQTISN